MLKKVGLLIFGLLAFLVPEVSQDAFDALRQSEYLWFYQWACGALAVVAVLLMVPWSKLSEWHSRRQFDTGPHLLSESTGLEALPQATRLAAALPIQIDGLAIDETKGNYLTARIGISTQGARSVLGASVIIEGVETVPESVSET